MAAFVSAFRCKLVQMLSANAMFACQINKDFINISVNSDDPGHVLWYSLITNCNIITLVSYNVAKNIYFKKKLPLRLFNYLKS